MKSIDYILKKNLIKMQAKRKINFKSLMPLFSGKNGLEVGGPSKIFRDGKNLPVYKIANELDGRNFSNQTIWEGNIDGNKKYQYYENKNGIQYISEATDLNQIPDSKYDFVISSNCLEHVANPLKAVEEWIRVMKKGGAILLVLPNKEFCFDHKRPFTKFSHLLADYQSNIQEDDLTHLEEILELHDLNRDKLAGTFKQFKERSLKNFENRALHQHVFDIDVLKEIFVFFQFRNQIYLRGY